MRPKSIVQFQWAYLAYILLSFVSLLLSWDAVAAELEVNPATAQMGMETMLTITWVVTGIGYAISFLLWWLVAFKASTVAKWIVVVFFAFSLLATIWTVATESFVVELVQLLGLVLLVVHAYAIWLLFRPDARAWLGEVKAETAGEVAGE